MSKYSRIVLLPHLFHPHRLHPHLSLPLHSICPYLQLRPHLYRQTTRLRHRRLMKHLLPRNLTRLKQLKGCFLTSPMSLLRMRTRLHLVRLPALLSVFLATLLQQTFRGS